MVNEQFLLFAQLLKQRVAQNTDAEVFIALHALEHTALEGEHACVVAETIYLVLHHEFALRVDLDIESIARIQPGEALLQPLDQFFEGHGRPTEKTHWLSSHVALHEAEFAIETQTCHFLE